MSWKYFWDVKNCETNTNLEPERLEIIRKRQVVSPAKLKLLEKIVHISSHFFKKSHSYAIQINLPWQLLSIFPFSLQDIYAWFSSLYAFTSPSVQQSCSALTIQRSNIFLNDKIKQRARDCNGICGTITNVRWQLKSSLYICRRAKVVQEWGIS